MGELQVIDKLKEFQKGKCCVLLGISPLSIEIVDTAIQYANFHRVPIMLVASQRQVDSERFGCGYVNRWTAQSFAKYVKQRDKGGYTAICRDHGGPWQNTSEIKKKPNL